jgi:hypothetical protein
MGLAAKALEKRPAEGMARQLDLRQLYSGIAYHAYAALLAR